MTMNSKRRLCQQGSAIERIARVVAATLLLLPFAAPLGTANAGSLLRRVLENDRRQEAERQARRVRERMALGATPQAGTGQATQQMAERPEPEASTSQPQAEASHPAPSASPTAGAEKGSTADGQRSFDERLRQAADKLPSISHLFGFVFALMFFTYGFRMCRSSLPTPEPPKKPRLHARFWE